MFKGISKKLGGIAAAVGGAIAGKAVISGLQDIGAQFDEMTDNIIVGTGASGSALEALKDSAKGIATAVGGSFADAGDVVQDLNTRLGLTGGNLDAVGQRVVAAGKLIGSAINTEQLSGAFTAFDVGADQMADKMDYLFSVSQNTGIGFDTLTGIIEKNAVPLREMGMSFEESANMAGLLDKAGLNASSVMAKMSKALVSLAKPGESAADAFRRTVGEIGDYIDAGNQAAAIELASKVFGTKGAAEFVGAIQSGALALDSLTDSAVGAGAGIMGTFEATADWPEKLDILKNKFTEILEPLGSAVFSSFGDSLDLVGEALDEMDPSAMQALSKSVAGFVSSGVQKVIDFRIDGSSIISRTYPATSASPPTPSPLLRPL